MPELPEVEIIAQGLRRQMCGAYIQAVQVLWPRSLAEPDVEAFCRALAGDQVRDIRRRGKFILFYLASGRVLLAHLRMTGGFVLVPCGKARHPHVRAVFALDNGHELWFVDMRKFGRLYLTEDAEAITGGLGIEPLSDAFTAEWLGEAVRRRAGRIKPLLLDQSFIAGLGNIYTDEALFRAGVHPLRPARELSEEEIRRLHHAVRKVLEDALAHRGTTVRDYRDAEGRAGHNQFHLAVYRRQGSPCRRCGAPIERSVVGQRGTYFCPCCQPAE